MKKRITIISFLVFVLILMLFIGLFTREVNESRVPLESSSGEVDVVSIELLPNSIYYPRCCFSWEEKERKYHARRFLNMRAYNGISDLKCGEIMAK